MGNLCLFGSDLVWEPAAEDPIIVSARDSLLEVLAEVGGRIPGDPWVLGQRIRYLGDTGRWEEAENLARDCHHRREWWCPALLGYVLHRSGQVVEALAAFSEALNLMEPEQAREWTDPHPLLTYPATRWLRNPGGLSPAAAVTRFWQLADPLYLTPGNERLSEHYARRFAPALYDNTALTMGLPWSGAFEELLLRYGFVAGWEKVPSSAARAAVTGVVEHHHPESRELLPPFEALEDPARLPEDAWVPVDEHPRNASAPVRAPLVAHGKGQIAVMRRDGNLLVLAAWGVPEDTVFLRRRGGIGESVEGGREDENPPERLRRPQWEPSVVGSSRDTLSGLYLVADTGGWAPHSAFGVGGEGVLQASVPTGRYLASLEQWSPRDRWGARIRHGIEAPFIPPDVPHLSDLAFLWSSESLPASLEEALPRLRPSVRFASGETITVAWEVYGLSLRGEPLTFVLSLVGEDESFVRRTLNRIGLFRRDPFLTLSWDEEGAKELGPYFRAMEVDLPPLDPGRYQLRLRMRIPHRNTVETSRAITVF